MLGYEWPQNHIEDENAQNAPLLPPAFVALELIQNA